MRRLLDGFNPGEVMLADSLYCNYFLIAALMAKGVDVLFEQNGLRITDFRRGQSLGTRDSHRALAQAGHTCAVDDARAIRRRPRWAEILTITLREVKVAHQVLVTTRLDHRRVSKDDLSVLCGRRWNVELDLRNLKTTTGMDILSCQTPQMNEKQLWVH